jgi:hypothetical protein
MGAFNTVHVAWPASPGSDLMDVKVQFKYGDTWQYDYKVGDVLKWGGNDIGKKSANRVVVEGYLDAPADYPGVPESFEIHIIQGRIDKVIPSTGTFDFVKLGESFIILGNG